MFYKINLRRKGVQVLFEMYLLQRMKTGEEAYSNGVSLHDHVLNKICSVVLKMKCANRSMTDGLPNIYYDIVLGHCPFSAV
jgi:hypothetical protein